MVGASDRSSSRALTISRTEHLGLPELRLSRLLEEEVQTLRPYLAPVEPDYTHELHALFNSTTPTLPEALISLQDLFGEAARGCDPWKGSFQFPLLLSGIRNAVPLRYVVVVGDLRGSLKFWLYRIQLDKVLPPQSLGYAAPVEGELSRKEINWLFDLIAGHLKCHALCRKGSVEPFLRIVDSELIVYGFHDGSPFTRQFETHDLLHSFVDAFQQGASRPARDAAQIKKLPEW